MYTKSFYEFDCEKRNIGFYNIDVISTGLESEYVNVCNFSGRLGFITIYYLPKLKADMMHS